MGKGDHYLKNELYELIRTDPTIFEFLQQGSLDGIWYWDLIEMENEWMSPRFWEHMGYDPKEREHLASEWQDLIHPDDLKTALGNFEAHCADPTHPYDQIVRYRHQDGSTVWVRCRGVVIRDDDGKPKRMLGAHTDVTQQKLMEEELRGKTEELEEVNEKLLNALANVKTLRGLIPICASCKSIRDDKGYWKRIESYVSQHSEADFTHSICPACDEKLYGKLSDDHER